MYSEDEIKILTIDQMVERYPEIKICQEILETQEPCPFV